MRAVALGRPGRPGRSGGPGGPGGWVWGLSGVVTAALLAVPAAFLIGHAGQPGTMLGPGPRPASTFTAPGPVSALIVNGDGALVRITAAAVSRVKVTETITYAGAAAGAPVATESLSGGRLTLTNPAPASPACAGGGCAVAFAIIVPRGTAATVSSAGGPVFVSGTDARMSIDSGGGAVNATWLGGPLTVSTGGGPLMADGLAGSLTADTGGGPASARHLTSADAAVATEGGPATLDFAAAPRAVRVRTGGGLARVGLPGGPYALTADSGGGPESVDIPVDSAAGRSVTVTSGGAPLIITSATPGGPPPLKPGPGPGSPGRVSVSPHHMPPAGRP